MKRGDVVTVALQGDLGKPRPALVIQNDALGETTGVLVCPMTSSGLDLPDFRYPIAPTPENGLRRQSSVMLERIYSVPRLKCGPVIGSVAPEDMNEISLHLAFIIGLSG